MANSEEVRILYMEDDPGAANLFQKKLERLGYVVDLAVDGKAGIAMYDNGHYDVVTVDHHMPIYDGLQVIRLLTERRSPPPTIMLTGAGSERIAVEAMKLGASDYIIKDPSGTYLDLVPTIIEQLLVHQRLVEERQQALNDVQAQSHRLALVSHLGQRLSAMLSVGQIVKQLVLAVTSIPGAEGISVWTWDNDAGDTLSCLGTFGKQGYVSDPGIRVGANEGLVGAVASAGRIMRAIIVQGETETYPETAAYHHLPINSLLAIPMRVRDSIIGVLEIANGQALDFDEQEQALLETLTVSAAIALDNARLVETLRQQASDLQAQNEDLDAFAHTVAHDLKNPIALIIGYANVLAKLLANIISPDQFVYLERIVVGGRKIVSIIDELLLMAQIRKGDVERQALDMGAIVQGVQTRLGDMIRESQAQIYSPDSWPVGYGYAPWIEEIWVNYLSNALKYGSQPPEAQFGGRDLGNGMVQFWLSNRGAELTPEQCSQLFKQFSRLEQTHVEGHGLGLSIVGRIANKLGGDVAVENAPGYGPIFSFTLPSTDQPSG